jgi:hypothetical protein
MSPRDSRWTADSYWMVWAVGVCVLWGVVYLAQAWLDLWLKVLSRLEQLL